MSGDPFTTEWADHARGFETMDREELLGQARKWCFSALMARSQRERILSGTAMMLTSHERRLARLWMLADRTRKTIPMDDFMKAFGVGVSEDQENDK